MEKMIELNPSLAKANSEMDDEMPRAKKTDKAEGVVKIEQELLDLMKIVVAYRNREVKTGEKLTIAQYLSDIARKQIIHDYNQERSKSKPMKE